MKTFDFYYHNFRIEYPQNSTNLLFGNNWWFSSSPSCKPQRIFILTFYGIQYYVDENNIVTDSINPENNLLRLQNFYEEHQTYLPFYYSLPGEGLVVTRFYEPLKIPKLLPFGVVEDLEVSLIEHEAI